MPLTLHDLLISYNGTWMQSVNSLNRKKILLRHKRVISYYSAGLTKHAYIRVGAFTELCIVDAGIECWRRIKNIHHVHCDGGGVCTLGASSILMRGETH